MLFLVFFLVLAFALGVLWWIILGLIAYHFSRITDHVILPFVLAYRVVRGQMTFRMAWWLFDFWWPFKFVRRGRAKWRIWKANRYRGVDELHPSLGIDVWAMTQLTKDERNAYLENLDRRRARLHEMDLRRTG
jgi:hypothetical protein